MQPQLGIWKRFSVLSMRDLKEERERQDLCRFLPREAVPYSCHEHVSFIASKGIKLFSVNCVPSNSV